MNLKGRSQHKVVQLERFVRDQMSFSACPCQMRRATLGKTVGNTIDCTVYTKVRVYRHCVKTICFVEALLGGGSSKKTKQE